MTTTIGWPPNGYIEENKWGVSMKSNLMGTKLKSKSLENKKK
jgi:allophanate hydrolase subunit 2